MAKFFVLLADGCEDVEAITVIDYLRRVDVDVLTVSISDKLELLSKSKIVIKADAIFDDVDFDGGLGLYIPGGTQGAESLRDDDRVIDLVRKFDEAGKLVAGICAGPIVLNRAGVLENKKATSFPSLRDDLDKLGSYVDDELVVTDGNITTSRGAATTVYLALRLAEILQGREAVEELMAGTQHEAVESYYNISYDYINR